MRRRASKKDGDRQAQRHMERLRGRDKGNKKEGNRETQRKEEKYRERGRGTSTGMKRFGSRHTCIKVLVTDRHTEMQREKFLF